jgi:hypothetical protein
MRPSLWQEHFQITTVCLAGIVPQHPEDLYIPRRQILADGAVKTVFVPVTGERGKPAHPAGLGVARH